MIMNSPAFDPHWALFPRTYIAQPIHNAASSIVIDGDIYKDVWQSVPWSDPFNDITGDNNNNNDIPKTQFKAVYDDSYLYIAAILHPSPNLPTLAHFTQRNDPIYQQDSDFEVFIDIPGCNHFYKELELNAINTVWNLMLDKPYNDNGSEYSGRVAKPGDDHYYEVYKQRTATKVISGKLNDATEGALWTVEMALSLDDLYAHLPDKSRRKFWRINFSRVEKQGEINWTWQPQIVWDPATRQYKGQVNMHLPDAYGYIVFAPKRDDNNNNEVGINEADTDLINDKLCDPYWPLRLAAMNIYYAQHYYYDNIAPTIYNGQQRFAESVNDLALYLDTSVTSPFSISIILHDNEKKFTISLADNNNGKQVTINDDRFLLVSEHALESSPII